MRPLEQLNSGRSQPSSPVTILWIDDSGSPPGCQLGSAGPSAKHSVPGGYRIAAFNVDPQLLAMLGQPLEPEGGLFSLALDADLMAEAAAELQVEPASVSLGSKGQTSLRTLASSLRCLASDAGLSPALAHALAVAVAVELLRMDEGARPIPDGGALTRWRLRRVLAYVDAHLEADITVDDMAAAAKLSSFYFSRQFRTATGLSPRQYVLRARIARAKILLVEQNLPLAQVALACGFCNQAHFTTTFRKVSGVTPAVYRRAQQF